MLVSGCAIINPDEKTLECPRCQKRQVGNTLCEDCQFDLIRIQGEILKGRKLHLSKKEVLEPYEEPRPS